MPLPSPAKGGQQAPFREGWGWRGRRARPLTSPTPHPAYTQLSLCLGLHGSLPCLLPRTQHPGLLRSHSLALLASLTPSSQCFEMTSTPACLAYPRSSRAGACFLVPHPSAQCLAHGPNSKERKGRKRGTGSNHGVPEAWKSMYFVPCGAYNSRNTKPFLLGRGLSWRRDPRRAPRRGNSAGSRVRGPAPRVAGNPERESPPWSWGPVCAQAVASPIPVFSKDGGTAKQSLFPGRPSSFTL